MLEVAEIVLVVVAVLAHQLHLVLAHRHLLESLYYFVDPQEVFQRSKDIVQVVELVVLHVLANEHVPLAILESLHQHFN